jgi:hypothetical protein
MAQTRRPPESGPRPAPARAAPTLEDTRRSPGRIVARVAIVLTVVGIAVMWGFAFFGSYESPGRLEDRTFPTAAEPICKVAKAEVDALPPAFVAKSATERADVIVQGSDRLDRMIAELRTKVPPGDDAAGINQWLDDWGRYVLDRREYADQLRLDPNARFLVTQSDRDRSQITKGVDLFATVNAMGSCVTPTDLGG